MDLAENQFITERGPEDGLPLIFIHGFPFDHTMWDDLCHRIEQDFRIILYDIRGLGKSEYGDGPWGFERYVKDLEDIVRAQKEPPVLIGLSMGGYIALRAMEKNQDRYRGAILLDTRATDDPDEARVNRNALSELILKKGLGTFLKDFIPGTFGTTTKESNPALMDSTTQKALEFSSTGVRGALIAMSTRTSTMDFVKNCRLPLLWIAGQQDTLTPPEMMQELANQTPDGQFIEIPHAGHLPPLENPDAVVNAMLPFLVKIKESSR